MLCGQPKIARWPIAATVEAGRVEQKRAELVGRLGVHFGRVEPFVQAGKYARGLMSDLLAKCARILWERLHQQFLHRLNVISEIDWSRAVVDSISVRALKRGT